MRGAEGEAPRARIGPYDLLAPLGEGGAGAVFSARHRESGALRAVKVLTQLGPRSVARFEREARALLALRSPFVVRAHEAGVEGGRPWLALDLVEGEPLDRLLARGRPPLARALRLARDLARGVGALHAIEVAHRDVKPSNVIVRADGAPVVVDLGIALLAEAERLTRTGALVGTPAYMAPEQAGADRGAQGPRTDVFALGLIVFELVTGRPARDLEGADAVSALIRAADAQVPAPSTVDPALPRALDALVARATAAAPEDRFPDASALAAALDRLLLAVEGHALAEPGARRPRALAAVAAAVLAALALGAVVTGVGAPPGGPRADAARPAAAGGPGAVVVEGDARAEPAEDGRTAPPAPSAGSAPPADADGAPEAAPVARALEGALLSWRRRDGGWARARLPAWSAACERILASAGPAADEPALAPWRALARGTAALVRGVGPGRPRVEALAALDAARAELAGIASPWRELLALEVARLGFDRGRFADAAEVLALVDDRALGRPWLEARHLEAMIRLWNEGGAARSAELGALAAADPGGVVGLKAAAARARFAPELTAQARRDAAIERATAALALDPDDVDAATTLAYALAERSSARRNVHDRAGAQEDLERGLRLLEEDVLARTPDHARASLGAASMLDRIGRPEDAVVRLVETVALLGVEAPQEDIGEFAADLVRRRPGLGARLRERAGGLPEAERAWLLERAGGGPR